MDSSEMIPLMKRYEELDIENEGRQDKLLPEQQQIKAQLKKAHLHIGVDEYGSVAVWLKETA